MPVVVATPPFGDPARPAPISDGRYPHGDVVTVVNQGAKTGTDPEGNDIYGDVEIDYVGAFDPAIGFESTGLQDQVQTQPGVYLPYSAVVTSTSQVILRTGPYATPGNLYQVDGTPAYWKNPHSGHTPGVQVPLKRVTG